MKMKSTLKILATSLLSVIALTSVSYGATAFGNGALTTSDPTFHHPNASTVGTGVQYYDVFQFTVDASGSYVIELASLNTSGTPSNALDTFYAVYANTFNPASPGAGIGFDDDFTGTFTVLPGPFAGMGYTATSTGFSGTQPGSRTDSPLSLVSGTQYFLVITSFRSTDFVGTGTNGQPTGNYVFGVSGPGNITIVPEPTTTALLIVAAAGLGVGALRRRNSA